MHSLRGIWLVFVLASVLAQAQSDRKAIIIGIDCYNPAASECAHLAAIPPDHSAIRFGVSTGNWNYWKYDNLTGAVADAKMMKKILEDRGFTIPPDAYLTNAQATASAILNVLRKYLIDDTKNSRAGDLRFVYYSGHGNYVRNLAVTDPRDPDRLDETMVPSDHWRGTPDIRDKELSRIFTEASKHVKIVFMADSCHSGSLSRSPGGMAKTARSGYADAPGAPKVTDQAPPDESRKNGLIALAAARRDQIAEEREGNDVDISDPEAGPHGAFTWAVRQAWLSQPNAPLDLLFQKASALLALDKPNQVPNLDGVDTAHVNLFGEAVNPGEEQAYVVQQVDGDDVRLRGGSTAGIFKNTELKRISGVGANVRIRVTAEEGVAFSRAVAINALPGRNPVHKGDLFIIDKKVVPLNAMLSIFLPPAIPADSLDRMMAEFSGLPERLGANWIADEAAATPTHTLRWSGKTWLLEKGDLEDGGADMGAAPTADAIAAQLPSGAKLFVSMPPSRELMALFSFDKLDTRRIVLTRSPGGANYRLRGRIHEGKVEYSWMQPAVNTPAVRIASQTNQLRLPLGTDWVKTENLKETARDLADKAYRLGRLREWQSLSAVGPSSAGFPYRMEIRENATGQAIASGRVVIGKEYKVYLKATPSAIKAAGTITPRYTYIFAIDQFGKGYLIWPEPGQGNQDNLFPAPISGDDNLTAPSEIPVSGKAKFDFKITDPNARYTYLMLTSVQKLDDPDILDFDGVRVTAPQNRTFGDSFTNLIFGVGTLSRAPIDAIPTSWGLETTVIQSEAATAK